MKRMVYGVYDDEEVLMKGIKTLQEKGIDILEVYTPFPVHGLEKVFKRCTPTRLPEASFLYGFIGLSLGILMVWYMNIHDWSINIGGKPNFSLIDNLPAFVPVLFELTVLCAAHGMVITFFVRSNLKPGNRPANPLPETTNDMFAVEIEKGSLIETEQLYVLLKETGVCTIKEKEVEL
jgi:hypothetical protein